MSSVQVRASPSINRPGIERQRPYHTSISFSAPRPSRPNIKEAGELAQAIAAGADLRDENKRRIKPIGPSSLKKLLDTLAAIMQEAVEDGYIPANPARGRRLHDARLSESTLIALALTLAGLR